MKIVVPALLLALAGSAAFSQSDGMQTDWLEFVKGHKGAAIGAEVRDIVTDPATGEHSVTIAIPKESVTDESSMEEIVVIGKAPDDPDRIEFFPELETRWVDDYDNENYGLLVKLKSGQNLPFRLFFSAQGQGGGLNNGAQP